MDPFNSAHLRANRLLGWEKDTCSGCSEKPAAIDNLVQASRAHSFAENHPEMGAFQSWINWSHFRRETA
eukprot:1877074-Rhodomonas_salina.1